jgi:class 3 adenylate cyclase
MNAVVDELRALFLTDVEGSTPLWQREPHRMPSALDLLDEAVEAAVDPFGGYIVRSRGEGDSHFVVFKSATAAVRAAASLQDTLAEAAWPGEPLRLRIAIHAGEVQPRKDDYDGIAIHHAARLRSAAHGGQVVVSRAVAELVGMGLEPGLRLESLGRHRLRDIPGWTEVFQLGRNGVCRTFPSLVTLDKGLPPITAIVMLDAVGITAVTMGANDEGVRSAFGRLVELFASTFAECGGQYLKLHGDGCLALFADPDVGITFARTARTDARRFGVSLRSAVNLGRVEFVREEPVGRLLLDAWTLLSRADAERIALSRAAAAMVDAADDLVTID